MLTLLYILTLPCCSWVVLWSAVSADVSSSSMTADDDAKRLRAASSRSRPTTNVDLMRISDQWTSSSTHTQIILTSLYLVEGLAWWDWPFTWWTDQLFSFSAWHCWLGHLTRVKIVPNRPIINMTYNVFSGTLNPTLLHPHSHTCDNLSSTNTSHSQHPSNKVSK